MKSYTLWKCWFDSFVIIINISDYCSSSRALIIRSALDAWLNYSIIVWCNLSVKILSIDTLDMRKEFKSLGGQQWRSKQRVSGKHRASVNTPLLQPDLTNADSTGNRRIVEC